MGNFSDVETATYLFDHCLLRTGEPETIDEAHYKGVIWGRTSRTRRPSGERTSSRSTMTSSTSTSTSTASPTPSTRRRFRQRDGDAPTATDCPRRAARHRMLRISEACRAIGAVSRAAGAGDCQRCLTQEVQPFSGFKLKIPSFFFVNWKNRSIFAPALKLKAFGGVAQPVALLVWDKVVAGSNPVAPTEERVRLTRLIWLFLFQNPRRSLLQSFVYISLYYSMKKKASCFFQQGKQQPRRLF